MCELEYPLYYFEVMFFYTFALSIPTLRVLSVKGLTGYRLYLKFFYNFHKLFSMQKWSCTLWYFNHKVTTSFTRFLCIFKNFGVNVVSKTYTKHLKPLKTLALFIQTLHRREIRDIIKKLLHRIFIANCQVYTF